MVGRLGPAAQAAAGLGGFAFFVLANLTIGLGTAVQALVARRVGEGRDEDAGASLDSALLLSAFVALPLGVVLSRGAGPMFRLLSPDPAVQMLGADYLEVRLVALGVLTANFSFRGFWNGIDRSRTFLAALGVQQVVNIVLNWVFIYGNLGAPAMGVRGAGLAGAVATVCCTVVYCVLTTLDRPVRERFRLFRFESFSRERVRALTNIALPENLRGIGTMVGYLLFLRLHAGLGTREAAAGTILVNVASTGFLPALGLGLAGATFLGQSLGRGEPDEGRRTVWVAIRLGVVTLLPATLLLLAAPVPILSLFTADRLVVELAVAPLRLFACTMLVDVVPIVILFSLLGAGATRWVAGAQLMQQFLLLLPLGYLLGHTFSWSVFGLWISMALSRSALLLLAVPKLRGDSWTTVRV
jgi:putative MATE family efflux protein